VNGAEAILSTAVASGVKVCFANPGTTEITLLAALDANPQLRSVLCLAEGICSGAADGYGRMSDFTALTLTHLGPGFSNMIANLHNARRARSPVLNIVGEHATWHARHKTMLSMDIAALAGTVSAWVRTCLTAEQSPFDFRDAVEYAAGVPGAIATLILPADCQWESSNPAPAARVRRKFQSPSAQAVEQCAAILRPGTLSALLLSGYALREKALRHAETVARRTGCDLLCETLPARVERGSSLPSLTRVPYFPEQARQAFSKYRHVIAVGAGEPLAVFGYRNGASEIIPAETQLHTLADPETDPEEALSALAEMFPEQTSKTRTPPEAPVRPTAPLNPFSFGAAVAHLQPEHAIVVDESATSGGPYSSISAGCAPFTILSLSGGAIGYGMPCAVGAAVACPERKVICLQADGGGMYSPQALWTAAREALDITVIICANRSYRILQMELTRSGNHQFGAASRALTSLDDPPINWCGLARSLGVEAAQVNDTESLLEQLAAAFRTRGPRLIEVLL
jgi:acetolactate synthase-1/2/3 large subunit